MKKYKGLIITLAVVVGFAGLIVREAMKPGAYDQFASCLSDKGVVFYGTFWCPHCERTKAEFGNSFKKLTAYECSTPDRRQTKECAEAGVEAYPTWGFVDGSKKTGALSFAQLSEITGCAIDGQDTNPVVDQDSASE